MSAPGACETTRGMLSSYLDGELTPEYAAAVRAHLAGCAACRAELALLEGVVGALRRLPDLPPPAGIVAGVRSGLSPRPWYRRLGAHRTGLIFGVPIGAAATLLVVLGVTLFQGRHAPIVRQPVSEAPAPPAPAAPQKPEAEAPAPTPPPAPAAVPAKREAAPLAGKIARAPIAKDAVPAAEVAVAPTAPAPERAVDVPPPAAPREAPWEAAPEERAERVAAERPAFRGAPPPAPAPIETRAIGRRREAPASPFAAARSAGRELPDEGAVGRRPLGAGRADRDGTTAAVAARFASKAPAAAFEASADREPLEVIYVWAGDGEDLADLRGILGREGGRLLEVRAIDPRTGREALLPLQEQMIPTSQRVQGGWEIDASLPRRNLARFLDAVERRRGYQLLQRLPAREGPGPPAEQRVKIRVFR